MSIIKNKTFIISMLIFILASSFLWISQSYWINYGIMVTHDKYTVGDNLPMNKIFVLSGTYSNNLFYSPNKTVWITLTNSNVFIPEGQRKLLVATPDPQTIKIKNTSLSISTLSSNITISQPIYVLKVLQ